MATYKKRVELLESEVAFRIWLWWERIGEHLSPKQLKESIYLGLRPDPLPAPLPKGASKLDGLGRKRLIERWKEFMRHVGSRSQEELNFHVIHGHWPEQACNKQNCSKAKSDKIVRRYEARRGSMPE